MPLLICALLGVLACVQLIFGIQPSFAEDPDQEIVVSATRIETPLEQVASSVTIITSDEIEQKQENTVLDALRSAPATDVVRSGGPGGNTAIFIRGANSEHTLVLIDGIEANNPISNNRAYNFADLPSDNIERIEILRGPQSTLYGSDAMGGVINIITKRGQGDPQISAATEAGSYNSYNERAGVSGGTSMYDYSASYYRQDTHGISAADRSFGNRESDSYRNNAFSSRVGFTPSEQADAQLFFRYIEAKTDLDNFGGTGGDDLNRVAGNEQLFTRAQTDFSFFDKTWKQTYGISYSHQKYSDNNEPDALDMLDILNSAYRGDLTKLDWQNTIRVNEALTFVTGAENEEETGESDYFSDGAFGPFEDNFSKRSTTTNGYYVQSQFSAYDRLYATTGLRVDDNSRFGSEVTWRIAPALLMKETGTKLSSTVGTGFKAPSLFQLYSSYGDPDLDPEKSLGVDAGIEQKLFNEKAEIGATFFYNTFDNLITFDPNTFIFSNISSAKTHGLETYIRSELSDVISLGASYTYTDTKDEDTDLSLLRRARHKAAVSLDYAPFEKANFNLTVLYTGKRADNDYATFPATRTTLGGYTVVNLACSYALTKEIELIARIENLFDKDYEEVFGYGTYGATAFGGVKVKL